MDFHCYELFGWCAFILCAHNNPKTDNITNCATKFVQISKSYLISTEKTDEVYDTLKLTTVQFQQYYRLVFSWYNTLCEVSEFKPSDSRLNILQALIKNVFASKSDAESKTFEECYANLKANSAQFFTWAGFADIRIEVKNFFTIMQESLKLLSIIHLISLNTSILEQNHYSYFESLKVAMLDAEKDLTSNLSETKEIRYVPTERYDELFGILRECKYMITNLVLFFESRNSSLVRFMNNEPLAQVDDLKSVMFPYNDNKARIENDLLHPLLDPPSENGDIPTTSIVADKGIFGLNEKSFAMSDYSTNRGNHKRCLGCLSTENMIGQMVWKRVQPDNNDEEHDEEVKENFQPHNSYSWKCGHGFMFNRTGIWTPCEKDDIRVREYLKCFK